MGHPVLILRVVKLIMQQWVIPIFTFVRKNYKSTSVQMDG